MSLLVQESRLFLLVFHLGLDVKEGARCFDAALGRRDIKLALRHALAEVAASRPQLLLLLKQLLLPLLYPQALRK